jgi:O-antigen/teichoic acid export membrane protein
VTSRTLEVRAARVSLVTGTSTVLTVVLQLVSVPICIKYWGQGNYGTWLTVFAAFMLLRSLDGGYVAYVGNKLNYLYHVDERRLRTHLASGLIGTLVIGCFQLALGVWIAFSPHLGQFFGLGAESAAGAGDGVGLLILLVSWALTGSYLGIVHRLMVPAGMMYEAAWWFMAVQLTQFIAIIVAALSGFSILQASALFAIMQAVVYLASAVYIRRRLPDFYPWWDGARWRVGLSDLLHSGAFTVSSLVQHASTSGVVLLISAMAGPAAVPVFTTLRTISNLWTNLTHVLTNPLLPEVIRFDANGEREKLRATLEAHWVLAGGVVNFSVLLLYPFLPALYAVWTGHALPLDRNLLAFLLAAVVVANVGALISLYLNGINHLPFVLGTTVVRCACVLGIGAAAYPHFGLTSFGAAVLAGEVIVLAAGIFNLWRRQAAAGRERGSAESFAPALTGAGAVLAFLLFSNGGPATLAWTLPLAAAGVLASVLWGWSRLPGNVKDRLVQLSGVTRIAAPVTPSQRPADRK